VESLGKNYLEQLDQKKNINLKNFICLSGDVGWEKR